MSRRIERLSKLVKQEISDLLEREVCDPRLSNLITVTEVSISPDLKFAKIYVSMLGDIADAKHMLEGFNTASGFLRRELSSRIRVRRIPQLSFYYDDSIERGARVLQLIDQVNRTA